MRDVGCTDVQWLARAVKLGPDVPRQRSDDDYCVVCRQLIKPGEHKWGVPNDSHRYVHEHCRDWSRAPFPFDYQLRTLTAWYYRTRKLQREIVKVGRVLRSIERNWPAEGAAGYRRGRAALDGLMTLVREAVETKKWPLL